MKSKFLADIRSPLDTSADTAFRIELVTHHGKPHSNLKGRLFWALQHIKHFISAHLLLRSSSRPFYADARFKSLERVLIEGEICTRKDFDRAIAASQDLEGVTPCQALITLGIVSERSLALAYSKALKMTLARGADYPISPILPTVLRRPFLSAQRVVPLSTDGKCVCLAVADALDEFTPASVALATGQKVLVCVGIPEEIEAAIQRLYFAKPGQLVLRSGLGSDIQHQDDIGQLEDHVSSAPIINLVNEILQNAVDSRASDVHIDGTIAEMHVRFRCDGMLYRAYSLSPGLRSTVINRIKIMSNLDISEQRLPQDGRIRVVIRGESVDLRISTAPSIDGEKAVIRILDRNQISADYKRLGLPDLLIQQWNEALRRSSGALLVAGPTGSGKTTTLYTALMGMNDLSKNIITIEDPVEFRLPGIHQISVQYQIGLDFPSLLRSILRQDPDVILIGEIRDAKTAQIAAQAALTGHLVLSTVHTNSAAAAITRLQSLGLDMSLLKSVFRGVLAQRLVRCLCDACKEKESDPHTILESVGIKTFPRDEALTLWRAVGCEKCRITGYRGRRPIAEFLRPSRRIESLILNGADEEEIEKAAISEGMITMFDAGINLARSGVTTVEEVIRCVGFDSSDR